METEAPAFRFPTWMNLTLLLATLGWPPPHVHRTDITVMLTSPAAAYTFAIGQHTRKVIVLGLSFILNVIFVVDSLILIVTLNINGC
ncbi:hypothetical protein BDR07DRAFT_1418565 [Suillus spraguei]|nr:hypothetical protein BDR07DRAFT_1418565 [Suillus spraguei]